MRIIDKKYKFFNKHLDIQIGYQKNLKNIRIFKLGWSPVYKNGKIFHLMLLGFTFSVIYGTKRDEVDLNELRETVKRRKERLKIIEELTNEQ